MTPDPKRCSTRSAVTNTKSYLTFEWPCVPPKTHRIWNGGKAPDLLPLSFWRYAWPFKSYRGVKIQLFTFMLHHLGPGVCFSRELQFNGSKRSPAPPGFFEYLPRARSRRGAASRHFTKSTPLRHGAQQQLVTSKRRNRI